MIQSVRRSLGKAVHWAETADRQHRRTTSEVSKERKLQSLLADRVCVDQVRSCGRGAASALSLLFHSTSRSVQGPGQGVHRPAGAGQLCLDPAGPALWQ